MTDIGFTGGGKGSGTRSIIAGVPDHKMDNEQMVDHIVELVEARAAQIDAEALANLQAAE
jgi:(E)-4-hydroxy-3-methylbut-2-enyl-diphosphate synthase